MYFCYNIFLYIIYPILLLSALFSNQLRKNIQIRFYRPKISQDSKEDRFWFHAASVGEYEQIRPLILKVKQEYPHSIIYVSVFSYSGYQQCYESHIMDYFFSLPFDFYFTMRKLMRQIKPKAIFYSRYDVWPNMVRFGHTQGVRQVLVSATLAERSLRRNFIISAFYSRVYSYLDHIFVIDQIHQERFQKLKLEALIAGDTRYDSIQYRINHKNYANMDIQSIRESAAQNNKRILVAGSTYDISEHFLLEFMHKSKNPPLLILTPHHTDEQHILTIEQKINNYSLSYIKYTDWVQNKALNSLPSIFLIDTLGILLQLYSIGDIAYIGGGWRGSVHSTIEPAFFKIPILTGPEIYNSQDALDFKKIGLIKTMKKAEYQEVELWYQSMTRFKFNKNIHAKIEAYIRQKSGASDKIYNELIFLNRNKL